MVLITQNDSRMALGSALPDFNVIDTAGAVVSRNSLLDPAIQRARGLVVVFTCNHCPYAQCYEDRTIALARKTLPLGIRWIGINSNAANKNYPDDSFDEMKRRARSKNYPFPYAVDETQEAARSFRAACTPEYFLFDQGPVPSRSGGSLCYSGRLDDQQDPSKVTKTYLADAIEDVLSGAHVRIPHSDAIGCSIKWVD